MPTSVSRVTERPILFSAPMVRAILAGAKTQTRRAMRVDNHPAIHDWVIDSEGRAAARALNDQVLDQYVTTFPHGRVLCPYGVAGDRLWVRERHSFNEVRKLSKAKEWHQEWDVAVEYADGTEREVTVSHKPKQTRERGEVGWRPSIHMPRWASRITLEITGVRVERLQDISEDDSRAEGVDPPPRPYPVWGMGGGSAREAAAQDAWTRTYGNWHRYAYRVLWESINGADSWAANPWVWVVEFKRVSG